MQEKLWDREKHLPFPPVLISPSSPSTPPSSNTSVPTRGRQRCSRPVPHRSANLWKRAALERSIFDSSSLPLCLPQAETPPWTSTPASGGPTHPHCHGTGISDASVFKGLAPEDLQRAGPHAARVPGDEPSATSSTARLRPQVEREKQQTPGIASHLQGSSLTAK